MRIALSTDHAGFEKLPILINHLTEQGHECVNFGPTEFVPDDDYPDLIVPAARAVASRECEMGVVIGGSGQGENDVANKIKGVRGAVFYGPATPVEAIDAEGTVSEDPYDILRLSRQHNNANLLSLAARYLTAEAMIEAVDIWISTPFSGAERHQRRNDKLDQMG
jgi:ribose 5-phosphate isomerase B